MDIGIIGGADGPTAVLVSSPIPLWLVVCGGCAAVAIVVAVLVLAFKNKQ